MTDPFALARFLVRYGAGLSARRVLGSARGFEANEIRAAADRARIGGGLFGLGVLEDGQGIAVPLHVVPGPSHAPDPVFRLAMERATTFARTACGALDLPAVHLAAEDVLSAFGDSLGLGAALAFAAHYAGAAQPHAVFVTGTLADDGTVLPIDHVDAKLAAARAHRLADGVEAVVLDPATTATFAQALRRVVGVHPLAARPDLLSLDRVLERSRLEPDHDAAIAMLEAVPQAPLREADRAQLQFELGMRLRHAGRSDDAARLHHAGQPHLVTHGHTIGRSMAERYEIEALATRIDAFDVAGATAALRARLAQPFLDQHNEVRCRGTLAQALAMQGRMDEAMALRRENLAVQDANDAMRRELPRTLCALTWDAARAGDEATFESAARRTCAETHPGDPTQWRYDVAAIARGLVALGRDVEALAWARGAGTALGVARPAVLRDLMAGDEAIATHPEVSVARALGRAMWRTGRPREAITWLARITVTPGEGADLVAWLATLARLEATLALHAAGAHDEAERERRAATAQLPVRHFGATAFHRDLLESTGDALARAIDRVWY